MSKSAKQIYVILIFLILGCAGFAVYSFLEKQKVLDNNARLQEELTQSESREKKALVEVRELKNEVTQLQNQRVQLQKQAQQAEEEATRLLAKAAELEQERGRWEDKFAQISEERDSLMSRMNSLIQQQQQVARQSPPIETPSESETEVATDAEEQEPVELVDEETIASEEVRLALGATEPIPSTDVYWAAILKDKAALEVRLEKTQELLSKRTQELLELKQRNANQNLEVDTLKSEAGHLREEIEYKGELINNLSLELARTKNEKKYVADRVSKLNAENAALRKDMQQLVRSKGSLEKSIVRLSHEKDKAARKLEDTESMIQSKIDEIWEIKDSIDHSYNRARGIAASAVTQEVELSPIVVSSGGGPAVPFDTGMSDPGLDARVVSVNEENNFVVIDVGQTHGVQMGSVLSVYRGGKYIASIKVIQVRNDISAADIKDQWQPIQVGDVIR